MVAFKIKSSPDISVKKRSRVYKEQALQISCVAWFDLQYQHIKQLLIHIPNGGARNFKINKYGKRFSPEAQRLKLMGTRSGVPDLFLAKPNTQYNGLWIEMKSDSGKNTPHQNEYIKLLQTVGYKVVVCNNFESFRNIIKDYLK